MVEAFRVRPGLGLLGGNVVAEGVTRAEAIRTLADGSSQGAEEVRPARALYGCSMCVRTDILRRVDFDENLRLVGWLEDFDWSVRAGRYGAIMCTTAARLVHLKTAQGRVSGYRFGYAQVVNPFYLYRKGTIPAFREVFERHWLRLIASNCAGIVRRDKGVDRWGRLRGNLRAFRDLCCGHADPARIEGL
jgi:GT2 family glycosyltransferase